MDWETGARTKIEKMISMIPFFQRKMAERLAGKKAEQYAQERGAAQVEEHHIVAALIAEHPGAVSEQYAGHGQDRGIR